MRAGGAPRAGPPAVPVDDDRDHVPRRGRESVLLLRRQGGVMTRFTQTYFDSSGSLNLILMTRPHLVRRLRRHLALGRFRVALCLPLLRLVVLGVAVETAADRVQDETCGHCAVVGAVLPSGEPESDII